ncbi:hypothetical protein ABH995_002761 [Bradyrhizobium yuanmingense]|uniref:DUF499 domain-containing protein n=1 Tax=Bradyrhizobium yuanmingense TaxID=108015 RepID=UPI0004AFDB43|nr:DUF499 domain-containing protein [Bradyrhizobium yuanmingense]
MSAEKELLTRVQNGLFHLQRGLTPFVTARMKAVHGDRWLHYASRAMGSAPNSALDAYGLVKTMLDRWREVFDDAFPRNEKHRVRNFASTSLEARNATAHLSIPLQDDEALRYLDAMHQLLKAVKAPEHDVVEVRKLYDAQRNHGVAPSQSLQAAAASPAAPKLDLAPPLAQSASGKALKPWIEVALPHPDVLANRFKEAEFAADLFAVDAGHATEDYGTAESFFRITFLTEGLRRVLTSSLQRLSGRGGDPIIGLQTAFGGGKTHTMLAVYHLAKSAELDHLEGVGQLFKAAGLTGWKKPQVAVFVGSSKGTDTSLILQNGPKVHTLWGYIAWRLAGERGLKIVSDAEAARTNPGSELMVEVLKLAGPSVILLDELVAYARQLPDDRFEAFLSFIQSLTEAVKIAPNALLVGSLPEANTEAGGEKGVEALARLEKVFGRVQSPWMPASGDETYEIIRRRLFQTLDSDGEKARDEAVKAFHDLYKKNAAEFPPEVREARYYDLLRMSYPIHPELFDRLSKDWASLDKFQRTRGVLRFMANVVGVLWHERVPDPLIMPSRVPIANDRIRASVLYPLDPAFGAIVDREVDGEGALPAQIEANPQRRISQARAATRAARAVFLCSAPLVGHPNAGIGAPALRLACAEPGDQLAIFAEALNELKQRAAYLYEEAGRFWFSTQPTLNRVADDRAKAYPDHEVDGAIARLLQEDATTKGGFHRVFATPDDATNIDEADALSLVILSSSMPHVGKGTARSAATDAVTDALTRCRASQRRLRNTLLFVAPDEAHLATARESVRRSMAWASIVADDKLQQQLTQAQTTDAKDKAKTSREGAQKAVRNAWSHVLYPVKNADTEAGKAFDLEHLAVSGRDKSAIPQDVYDKVRADGVAMDTLGAESLWRHVRPLWPEDRPRLPISEIVEWFASYVYLPKLRDRVVLEQAIKDALGKLDPMFGYAENYDAVNDAYQGLIFAKSPPEFFGPAAVLVRKEVALERLRHAPRSGAGAGGATPDTSAGSPQPELRKPPTVGKPRRFYGTVEIDAGNRPVNAFGKIIESVVMELQRTKGTKVKLTLEIEAEAPDGFDENDVGIVRDNTKQLKFTPGSTGFSE